MIYATEASALYDGQSRKDRHVATVMNMILRFIAMKLHPSKHIATTPNVTEPPNYDGPHVPVIVIMTSESRTYVSHNLKGLLSSQQDPITGVLQYYNSLFKIFNRVK
jgi:hypothetical protein